MSNIFPEYPHLIPGTKVRKPGVRLVGEDGNAYSIMGRTTAALRRALSAESVDPAPIIDAYRREAMSGDYDNLLATTMRYVDEAGWGDDSEE